MKYLSVIISCIALTGTSINIWIIYDMMSMNLKTYQTTERIQRNINDYIKRGDQRAEERQRKMLGK